MSYYRKYFVPETNEEATISSNTKKPKIDGNAIKQFYEQTVMNIHTEDEQQHKEKLKSVNAIKIQSNSKETETSTVVPEPSSKAFSAACDNKIQSARSVNNAILKAAQENDITGISNCLQLNCNVNTQDMYGWTPLMCAAKTGSHAALSYLLSQGADKTIKDTKGNSVWLIAENDEVALKILRKHETREVIKKVEPDNVTSDLLNSSDQQFYCDLCKIYFCDISREKHETSVVHLLQKNKSKPLFSCYEIPEENVGFQLMLRKGWNKDNGLGPDGQGIKYPLKTVLKTDRKGFGNKINTKARVTHFKQYDKKAILNRHATRHQGKKEGKKKRLDDLRKEKLKEIRFRRSFY